MKTTAPISPMPSKLKEIELDSQAGSQLKLLSEQKKWNDEITKQFEER